MCQYRERLLITVFLKGLFLQPRISFALALLDVLGDEVVASFLGSSCPLVQGVFGNFLLQSSSAIFMMSSTWSYAILGPDAYWAPLTETELGEVCWPEVWPTRHKFSSSKWHFNFSPRGARMADGHGGSGALQYELVILGLDVINAVGIICNFIRPSLDSSTLEYAIVCAYDVLRRPPGIPKE